MGRATKGGRHEAGDMRRATWGGKGGGGYRRVSCEWVRAVSMAEIMLADLRDDAIISEGLRRLRCVSAAMHSPAEPRASW